METKLNSDADISLAKMTVEVGATSELHRHSNCSETLHVLAGQIKQRVGDEWHVMNVGDTCFVKLGHSHQTENIGHDDAILMIAYSAGERVYSAD